MHTAELGPIGFHDIRMGDLVERKHRGVTAKISVVTRDEEILRNAEGGQLGDTEGTTWELLERTAPDLPDIPTWGWMIRHNRTQEFGHWVRTHANPFVGTIDVVRSKTEVSIWETEEVADFVPVELVPTQLLDDLRKMYKQAVSTERAADGPLGMFIGIAGRFLDYVDRTKGDVS